MKMEDIPHPTSKQAAPRGRVSFSDRVVRRLQWLKDVLDYIGGSREEPPPGVPFLASALWRGLWWGVLAGAILLFCGQTSKFIYIDF
jgi:hypothetical protein